MDENRKHLQRTQEKRRNKNFFSKVQELNAFQLENLAINGKGINFLRENLLSYGSPVIKPSGGGTKDKTNNHIPQASPRILDFGTHDIGVINEQVKQKPEEIDSDILA